MIARNKKYKPLYTTDKRYVVVTGGRGSGKSFEVSTFLSLLTHEEGHRVLFTRYTMSSAHLSIIPEFTEKLELLGVPDSFEVNKTEIRNNNTDSDILFKGLKTSSGIQTAALKSLQGITTWVLDEAEELVDEELFDKIDLSIRSNKKQNRIILVLNPASKEHWIYKRWFQGYSKHVSIDGYPVEISTHPDICHIHTSYLDNKANLPEDYLHQIETIKLNNPEKYKHVVLGSWLNKAEGTIFNNWSEGEYQDFQMNGYGLDFGFYPDPCAFLKCSISKEQKKIYVKELFYLQKLENSQLIANIVSTMDSNGMIVADNTEKRTIADIRNNGIRIKETKKGAGSIIEGIKLLQEFEIVVDPNSHNLKRELNNYVWHDKKADLPIDDYNHLLDSLRYIATDLIKASGRVQAMI